MRLVATMFSISAATFGQIECGMLSARPSDRPSGRGGDTRRLGGTLLPWLTAICAYSIRKSSLAQHPGRLNT